MARQRVRQTAVPRPPHPAIEATARGVAVQPGSAASPSDGFAALVERARQEILAVTYWFDPAPRPAPYPVTVRFTGHRLGVEGKAQPRDRFVHDELIPEVVPGSGPISITAKIEGTNPGEWEVSASILEAPQRGRGTKERTSAEARPASLGLTTRIWQRWAPSVESATHVRTCVAPFAHAPGALPLIWATMVGLGMLVAVLVQALVIAHDHLKAGPAFPLTVAAIAVGAVGAKVWFIVKHWSEHRFEGWCIQGFITGASLAAALLFTISHSPTGTVLDVSAPGLMFGVAVGRIGCYLAGCCGGPPTAARWGIWSSDQRIGARRVPTQLMESASAFLLGLAALVADLTRGPAGGAYFVAVLAAYVLLREGLLRLRIEQVQSRLRVPVTAITSALVLVVALVFAVR
jgi:phosphatidylglycerol:prolipoprotein diacylglycerol transferase